jgi:hypothetical protein
MLTLWRNLYDVTLDTQLGWIGRELGKQTLLVYYLVEKPRSHVPIIPTSNF